MYIFWLRDKDCKLGEHSFYNLLKKKHSIWLLTFIYKIEFYFILQFMPGMLTVSTHKVVIQRIVLQE